MRIHRLAPVLANQIAAGEVIERPASVAKELLENALDAGARDIRVQIDAGGSRRIQVRDDGSGIHADDLLLALDRHATGKIADANDLHRLATLGFRGEALPSIASVSRLRLCSRTGDAGQAREVQVEGGRIGEIMPAAHPPGTTVEVCDLFFNVPARRKFLRTDHTEGLHVLGTVRRLAFSRPEVAFTLLRDGREVLRLAAGTREQRVNDLMGRDFIRDARTVGLHGADLALEGWVGALRLARTQADRQYFYVNRRIIRDRHVNHAVRMACQNLLPTGRHPVYVLFLEMDAGAVDVNVHPTKHEVRFRDARGVHDFITSGLRRLLTLSAEMFPTQPPPPTRRPAAGQVREAMAGYQVLTQPAAPRSDAPAPAPVPAVAAATAATAAATAAVEPRYEPREAVATRPAARFCALESEDGLLLVDLHTARYHWLLARLRQADAGKLASRPLLVPISHRLKGTEAARVQACTPVLAELGIELEQLGPTSVVLRALPAVLGEIEAEDFLAACLQALAKSPSRPTRERLLEILARQAARHGAGGTGLPRQWLHDLQTMGKAVAGSYRHLNAGQLEALLREEA